MIEHHSAHVSVVIPVYRSASTLRELVDRLVFVLREVTSAFEIILVDDGSPDDSWSVLSELQEEYPDTVVAVQLMRNFGQHNALMRGLRTAQGCWIVTMDDDLQNPPEEIPKLLAVMADTECDLVYGQYGDKRHAPLRNIGSLLVNLFFRIVFHTRYTVTSFRAIRRELVDCVLPYDLNFTFLDGLLAWNTQRIGSISVVHQPRAQGRTGHSVRKLMTLALNLFTNFSLLPLQIASAVGFLAALVGFVLGLWYTALWVLQKIEVPGYASIIVAVFVLGGLQ